MSLLDSAAVPAETDSAAPTDTKVGTVSGPRWSPFPAPDLVTVANIIPPLEEPRGHLIING
ncbi:MAG: hypothetical protein GY926_12900, partial [bacterium]|nr:hypothetical protein [bacterium]